MTDEQFMKAAKAAEVVGAWRFAVKRIEEWESDDYGLFYKIQSPPPNLWESYKQSVTDWAKARLTEAEAEFAAI